MKSTEDTVETEFIQGHMLATQSELRTPLEDLRKEEQKLSGQKLIIKEASEK